MLPIILVSISGILVQGTHSFLLYSQRKDRKWSISHHAALNQQTRTAYMFAHLVAGISWIVAAYMLFSIHYPIIFVTFLAMAIFQWLQALTVGDPGTKSLHFKFAYAMWACAEFITIFGTLLLPLTAFERTLSTVLTLSIVVLSVYMFFRKTTRYYYLYQYVVIWFMFIAALLYAIALAN